MGKELDSSSGPTDVEWAIVQQAKKESFFNALQNIEGRVTEFARRTKALTLWEALISQLHSTNMLCAKVAKTQPAPTQTLNQLVDEFKERFAADSWNPLFASGEFSDRLGAVQSDVQILLYEHIQIFNRELEEIKNQFSTLLLSTQPPTFDISVQGNQQDDWIYESFQRLYQWACEGFRAVLTDCQHKKQSGAQWRNPDQRT